jgi:hypothetical protein
MAMRMGLGLTQIKAFFDSVKGYERAAPNTQPTEHIAERLFDTFHPMT